MYKEFKLTKKYSIAFNKFRKQAKTGNPEIQAYQTGICKSTDTINGFDTYFFVLGLYRMMIYVNRKDKCLCVKCK